MSIQNAEERRLVISQLELNLEKLTNEIDERNVEPSDLYYKMKGDLCQLLEEKTRSAIFRSKSMWNNESGKSTKYFLNLERNRSESRNMSTYICLESGEVIEDRHLILKHQETFYQKLYTAKDLPDFHTNLDKKYKLTKEQKETMDGEITLQELTMALKQSNRGRMPGGGDLPLSSILFF